MRRQSYGPSYRTTADDRNARMLERARVSFLPSTSPCTGDPRNMSLTPPLVTSQEPHTRSSDPVEVISSQFLNSDCLLDLDNDVIEHMATVDRTGIVESTINDRFNQVLDISTATEYNGFGDRVLCQPLSRNRSYRMASSPPPPPVPQPIPTQVHRQQTCSHDACIGVFPPTQPQGKNFLSKTDHIVIIELLKGVKPTDASDELELVSFLKGLLPLFNISPSCECEIIKLLIPKVQGQLFQLWMESISAQTQWNVLHCAILDRFIPPMRRREIESIELERPQRENETFSEYVEHILSVAFALKTNLSEREVIEIALNKCRPETRAYFNFSKKPTEIGELRNLASNVTSAVRAEERYFGKSRTYVFNNSARAYSSRPNHSRQASNETANHPSDLRQRPTQRITKCFKCNQEGHIARYCRSNLN